MERMRIDGKTIPHYSTLIPQFLIVGTCIPIGVEMFCVQKRNVSKD